MSRKNAYPRKRAMVAALAGTIPLIVKANCGSKIVSVTSNASSVDGRHEYDNTRTSTTASFAADPSGETSFTTLGASPVNDMAVLSAGATLLRANNLSLTLRYEVQMGSGYLSQSGSLRLRQLF
jgi:uncharacterized protein with beta-barrel porin domain